MLFAKLTCRSIGTNGRSSDNFRFYACFFQDEVKAFLFLNA